jgi:hypothetical protein
VAELPLSSSAPPRGAAREPLPTTAATLGTPPLRHLAGYVLAGIAILAVTLLATAQVSTLLSDAGPSTIVFLAVVIMLVAFAPCAVRLWRIRFFDPFEALYLFLVMYVLVFACRPLFLMSSWVRYVYELPTEVFPKMGLTDESIVTAMLLGLLGLVCFQLGYRSWQQPHARQQAQRSFGWSSSRVSVVLAVGIVLASFSLLVAALVIGSPTVALQNLGRLRTNLIGYGYLGLGMDWLPIVVLIAWADHLQTRKRWLFLPLILTSNMYNFALGSRAGILNLWLSMLVIYAYHRRGGLGLRGWLTAISVGCFALGLSLVLMEVRNTDITIRGDLGDVGTALTLEDKIGENLARTMLEFDQVDVFAFLVQTDGTIVPHLWGESYLGLFIQLVPRLLWEDKPWPYDVDIGWALQGVRTAIPPSMVGELHVNFDIPGIIIGMFLMGLFLRKLYEFTVAPAAGGPRDGSGPAMARVIPYALVLPYWPIILTRSFVGGGSTLLILLLPTLLAVWYVAGQRPVHGASTEMETVSDHN